MQLAGLSGPLRGSVPASGVTSTLCLSELWRPSAQLNERSFSVGIVLRMLSLVYQVICYKDDRSFLFRSSALKSYIGF